VGFYTNKRVSTVLSSSLDYAKSSRYQAGVEGIGLFTSLDESIDKGLCCIKENGGKKLGASIEEVYRFVEKHGGNAEEDGSNANQQ
jgi:hypothetical protein